MRTEVHIHGTLYLCKGVTQAQVETGLKKWLEYVDAESLSQMKSLEQSEPGLVFDKAERVLEICWTGDVGQNFHACLEETFHDFGTLTERASEIEVTYYHDNGDDEIQLMFVGPTAEAIHQAQRQRMLEDVSGLLARHFADEETGEVLAVVNQLFDRDWERMNLGAEHEPFSAGQMVKPSRRHLH